MRVPGEDPEEVEHESVPSKLKRREEGNSAMRNERQGDGDIADTYEREGRSHEFCKSQHYRGTEEFSQVTTRDHDLGVGRVK